MAGNKEPIRFGETISQTLHRDVHDIANSCDKHNPKGIDSWVEHIKSTFALYGYSHKEAK